MHIRCTCGVTLELDSDLIGRKVRCPECQHIMLVNSPAGGIQATKHQSARPTKPLYESKVLQLPGQRQRSSTGWQKKTAGPNKGLIIGVSVALGVVGLIAIIFAVSFALVSSDSQVVAIASNDRNKDPLLDSEDSSSSREAAHNASKHVTLAADLAGTPPTKKPKLGIESSPVTPANPRAPVSRSDDDHSDSRDEIPASRLETMDLVDLIEFVEPSVVRIDVSSNQGKSIGSGVFVDRDLIVTNYHVVQGAKKVTLTTSNGDKFDSTGFLHVDPLKDLAVISRNPIGSSVPALPIATKLPRKGEDVAAFGSPMGFSFSSTQGTVSAIRSGKEIREALMSLVGIDVYSILGYSEKTNWIQMNAAISGGNSGGPLTNMCGELVGINTFTNPAGQNLNFASTFEEVASVLEIARNAELKNFSKLPRQRITVEFPRAPANGDRDIAGRQPRGSNRNETRFGSPRDRFPSSDPPAGNSRSGRRPSANKPSRRAPPIGPDGTVTFERPRVLTPEEAEARRIRRKGTMKIVAEDTSKTFSGDSDPKIVRSFSTGNSPVIDLAISEDERFLAATTTDGTVHVFDNQQQGKLLYRIESEHRLFRRVTFTTGPTRLITGRDGGEDDFAHFRIPDTGEIEKGVKDIDHLKLQVLAASSDGRSIFGCKEGFSMLWRFGLMDDTPTPKLVFGGDGGEMLCAMFSPDDRILWAGSSSGWITAYSGSGNLIKATGLKQISEHSILDIAVYPLGSKLVAAGEDGHAYLVDVSGRNWNRRKLGERSKKEMISVCISPDGSLIATSSADRIVSIYQAKDKKKVKEIKLPSFAASIQFFGGDRYLVAGCKDGTIRIYQAK